MNLVPVDAAMPSTILHEGELGTPETAGEDIDLSKDMSSKARRPRSWFRKATRRRQDYAIRTVASERLLAIVRLRRCAVVECVVADASVRACAPATCEP